MSEYAGIEQVPLFNVTEPPVIPARPQIDPGAVRYTRLSGQTPCDDCMAAHATHPNAPLARRARWNRRQGTRSRFLCYAHACEWREEEGMKPLPED